MLKFVIVSILVFSFSATCEEQDLAPTPSIVEVIDDNDSNDYISSRQLRKDFASIVRCGLDISEPMTVSHIQSNIVGLNYIADNVVVKHLSKCNLKSSGINLDSLDVNLYLDCPLLNLAGRYNVTGVLIVLPLEGQGDATVILRNYGMSVKGKLKEFLGKDGEKHVKVKTFSVLPYVGGAVTFSLTNLFNGNEFLSTQAHKYINDNGKQVAEFVQEPAVYAVIKYLFKNVNKCLRRIAVENIVS